jgi:hypothetical protein
MLQCLEDYEIITSRDVFFVPIMGAPHGIMMGPSLDPIGDPIGGPKGIFFGVDKSCNLTKSDQPCVVAWLEELL